MYVKIRSDHFSPKQASCTNVVSGDRVILTCIRLDIHTLSPLYKAFLRISMIEVIIHSKAKIARNFHVVF